MYFLDENFLFPPVELASDDGLLAVGGDLSIERLLLAYHSGIFPWFNPEDPILWWSPPLRMVVDPKNYRAPKSLSSFMKRAPFDFTFNQEFEKVIRLCQTAPRNGQDGTWISDELIASFTKLHDLGWAKSVEVWQNGELVGGLYGVDLGHVFTGESMFSLVSNASKCAFVWLINYLNENNYDLLDCQIYNDHLALLGAFEMERIAFIEILNWSSKLS
jgi:leucyl/phenylalanyl-tRNA--protein transferase